MSDGPKFLKFSFGGEVHEIAKTREGLYNSFCKETFACKNCSLVWTGRLIRELVTKEIEELLKQDPISRIMLRRGEWRSLGVEDILNLKATIDLAIEIATSITNEDKGGNVETETTRTDES